MATEAEALLSGSGWLPEPLRTLGRMMAATAEPVEEVAADGGEPAMAADGARVEDEEVAFEPHAIAAE